MTPVHIKTLVHNGHRWNIIRYDNSYFARYGVSDTGPYSTVLQAEYFIKSIRNDLGKEDKHGLRK